MCSYNGKWVSSWIWVHHKKKVPKKILKCPECGRKLLQKVKDDGDGELFYVFPKHKVKGWWKKGKKKKTSRDNSLKRK